MKFKAFILDSGVNLLEKRFVPSLDKIGRICHMYLTRDHVFFLHNLLSRDGVQCIAQFRKEILFDDYRISSQNDDRIAFAVDLGLLHRALRSSLSIVGSERVQIKLVKKLSPGGPNLPMPFITFETKGYKSALIQDVPISKPLPRLDVLELQSALDAVQELPQTLVQVPDLLQLQHQIDRLKHIGDLLNVCITQYGDLHLQVSTSLANVGLEFRKLRVLGVQGLLMFPMAIKILVPELELKWQYKEEKLYLWFAFTSFACLIYGLFFKLIALNSKNMLAPVSCSKLV